MRSLRRGVTAVPRSMTLFHEVAPEMDVFQKVLDKFFEGKPDQKTIELL